MIQESGQITGISRSASYAVQSQLIERGYSWKGEENGTINTGNIYWYEKKANDACSANERRP